MVDAPRGVQGHTSQHSVQVWGVCHQPSTASQPPPMLEPARFDHTWPVLRRLGIGLRAVFAAPIPGDEIPAAGSCCDASAAGPPGRRGGQNNLISAPVGSPKECVTHGRAAWRQSSPPLLQFSAVKRTTTVNCATAVGTGEGEGNNNNLDCAKSNGTELCACFSLDATVGTSQLTLSSSSSSSSSDPRGVFRREPPPAFINH